MIWLVCFFPQHKDWTFQLPLLMSLLSRARVAPIHHAVQPPNKQISGEAVCKEIVGVQKHREESGQPQQHRQALGGHCPPTESAVPTLYGKLFNFVCLFFFFYFGLANFPNLHLSVIQFNQSVKATKISISQNKNKKEKKVAINIITNNDSTDNTDCRQPYYSEQ